MSFTLQENISLKNYTTLKTGGVARYFVQIAEVADLTAAITFAKDKQLPILVLGGGSNMLVADAGYPGLVLQIALRGMAYREDTARDMIVLTVGAGEVLDDVVADSVKRGYWGLENLSAIPGSVGATPVQNVGAYGCNF
jgi:UDP-N-acetylmuramate dehydrogenase